MHRPVFTAFEVILQAKVLHVDIVTSPVAAGKRMANVHGILVTHRFVVTCLMAAVLADKIARRH